MRCLLAATLSLALALAVQAHRLDEYLQATRLALSRQEIKLSLDLTPGVAIAPELMPLLRPDTRGVIIKSNQDAYLRQLLADLQLALDGTPKKITLMDAVVPPWSDLAAGGGTIHVTATVALVGLKPGPHEITFDNNHLPKMSVYLANALVPVDRTIKITGQKRDETQRHYRLQFEVAPR